MKPKTKPPEHCAGCFAYSAGTHRWCSFYGQLVEKAMSQCLTQDGRRKKLVSGAAFWPEDTAMGQKYRAALRHLERND